MRGSKPLIVKAQVVTLRAKEYAVADATITWSTLEMVTASTAGKTAQYREPLVGVLSVNVTVTSVLEAEVLVYASDVISGAG